MPIRFRCTSCERLLGIARRKAGTVIQCPDCAAEVIVPTEVTLNANPERNRAARQRKAAQQTVAAVEAKPAKNGTAQPVRTGESMPLFERPDFESLLKPELPVVPAPRAMEAEPVAPVAVPEAEADVVLVSRGNLTMVAVVIVVLVGLAFAAGYVIAAMTLPSAKA